VQRLKDWISRRLTWLDDNIPGTLNGCSMTGTSELALSDATVYPNPFLDVLEVNFEATGMETGSVRLLDASGRTIQSELFQSHPLMNSIKLENLSGLHSGIYFIELVLGQNKRVFKVSK
jgi:hypothetical protein